MNGHTPQPRVMREVPPEWDEIISLAEQIPNGEIVIKIYNKKVALSEYKLKKKPNDDLRTIPLI